LIISVDRHSGKERWRINTSHSFGGGRGLIRSKKGRAFIVRRQNKNTTILTAIDLTDGEFSWKKKVDGNYLAAHSGLVMFTSHGGHKCFSIKTGKDESCPPKPARRNRFTLTQDGTVYSYDYEGYLCAKEEKSGEKKWQVPVRGLPRFAPMYHDGLLYISTYNGLFYAIDPEKVKK
ncbi:MAG: PQQ-binding-like beta-propeller repeat protein, partial [Deltaproteobacteria bacterium]|nr:PQQ-binding-like beta-propeller repeat protein [Deltaproteobacteria bacterium]